MDKRNNNKWEREVSLVIKVFEEIAKESPRACAIVCGAYLDDALNELIKAKMVENEDLFKEMIDRLNFKRRIDLCYLLGLISSDDRDGLLIICNIRNKFAHNIELNTFEAEGIADKCKELDALVSKLYPHRKDVSGLDHDGPKLQFTRAMVNFKAQIDFATFVCKRIIPSILISPK